MTQVSSVPESEYAVLNNPNLGTVVPEAMSMVPRSQYSTGFGLYASSPGVVTSRNAAFEQFIKLVDEGILSAPSLQVVRDIQIVRDAFVSVAVGSDTDWFTTCRHFGFPSLELSRECAFVAHQLGQAFISQDSDLFEDCLDFLVEEPVLEMLETYIDTTLGGQPVQSEKDMAYILWSSEKPAILQIGTTELTLEETLEDTDSKLRSKHPHGVLAAWLVHDPNAAWSSISKELSRFNRGGNTFEAHPGEAKRRISELLRDTDNFVLSPWHTHL